MRSFYCFCNSIDNSVIHLTVSMLRIMVYLEMETNSIGEVFVYMLTEVRVREVIGSLKEPFLHKTLAELNAIEEIKIKEEKNHVSVKIADCKNRYS